ncbi:MAG: hypothetical protein IJ652_04795 [Bacteroidales bacterium]|nr:hypothetical protein [Bacteroidales bacterium]
MLKNSLIPLMFLLSVFCAAAQEPDSVAHLTLEKAVLTERTNRPMIENLGGVSGTVNMAKIQAIPSFLGNSDPIRFARLLPSIQVNAETDGGLYMQGSDYSHTVLSIGGVPIYGGSHLLGMFSVFNSPHFKAMDYTTSAGQLNRLGGRIDMELQDTLPARLGADLSAGLLSAQGTLRLPTGKHSALFFSARRSYINLIYGSFLKYDGQPIRYGFMDGNLTWLWKPGTRDRVWIDVFAGRDDASYDYQKASSSIAASWYNLMGAVHWTHYFPEVTLKQTAYATLNGLNAKVDVLYAKGELPSYIQTYGYRATAGYAGWDFLADVAWHRVQPQNPRSEGYYNQMNTASEPLQTALETKLAATYSHSLGYYLELKAGLGVTGYLSPEREWYWGLTPQADIIFNLMDAGKIDLRYGIYRQHLFQTGFTNVGLPCEFWLLAGRLTPPQWSHNVALAYNLDLADRAWSLSSEIYYKRLYNQVEYKGTIMEILNTDYSIEKALLPGDGHAYGLNLMLQKQQGKLTGWVAYALSRSLRHFDDPMYPGIYPSDHERLHELTVVATYDIGRFDFGGMFVAASGTPYTRPESFYLLGDRVICNYGERNAARLPAYIRLDLSANWYFGTPANFRV